MIYYIMLDAVLRKIAEFKDAKIAKYRTEQPAYTAREKSSLKAKGSGEPTFDVEKDTRIMTPPQTLAEFVELIRRTPKEVLSKTDRARIAAIMSFDEREVRDLMVPKKKMVFVKETEILGPLTLDKLYKSGWTNFPVVNYNGKVLGIIHTESLNALEIKDTDRATKYLDKTVHYLHTHDSLKTAIQEIERTNSYYFLVLDDLEELAGFFTVQMLLDYLLG